MHPEFWLLSVNSWQRLWRRPTWSELLRVAWDFDSQWRQRTNDTSSVSGVCEAYYFSIRCEPLYPKCNRICFNKSKNIIFADTSMAAPFCWLSKYPDDPDDQRFRQASRWKLCGLKRRFDKIISVCDICDICSSVLLLRFHGRFASQLHNQIRTMCKVTHLFVENWHIFFLFIILHYIPSLTVIIRWKVLFVKKNFFIYFCNRSWISDRRHVNTTENAMSPSDIFLPIWFGVC